MSKPEPFLCEVCQEATPHNLQEPGTELCVWCAFGKPEHPHFGHCEAYDEDFMLASQELLEAEGGL